MSKRAGLAEELMRSYNYARRFVGVLWEDDHGPVVLSQPEFPRDRLAALARMVLDETHPTSANLAQATRAREVFAITAGHLGKGWFHLGALERSDLHELIDEGVRPLRSLRGRDIDALVASFRDALEQAQLPVTRPRDLTERLERLFGGVGRSVAARFERALRPVVRPAGAGQLLDDFARTAERVVRNEGPTHPRLRPLWTRLAKLPVEPAARARALVGCLRDFAGGEAPHELGRRRTLEALVRGLPLEIAARRLVEEATPPDESAPRDAVSLAHRQKLLELALLTRQTSLELPRDRELLEPLLFIVEGRSNPNELEQLWNGVTCVPVRSVAVHRHTLRNSSLPVDLLVAALELDVLGSIWAFEDGESLRLYLDAVRQLKKHPIANIRPTDDWFIRPFASGFSWEPALMLSLLANHRKDPEAWVATLGAVRASELADFGFAEAFTRWDDPVLEPRPEEFDAVGEALNLTVTQLERYVYWRRVAGYETDFSETVLKPIRHAEREARELEHLRGMEQTASIAERIEALQDEERRTARLESAARRARNAFDRAMDVLRRESLDAVMDGVTRTAFERLLGRILRGNLPPRLRSLMLLLSAENVDADAIRALLEDVLASKDLAERPANVRWLHAMANRGMNTERWLRGVDFEARVGDDLLRIQTEMDPLHVLEMGSYFDTCLSLEDGFNAASTLTNAIDVNKQVLYGRRADGTVVARKLLSVTDDGLLLGYRTYAFESQRRLAAAVHHEIEGFAEECGLRLGTTGRPTALHNTFWYDDGVVPWRVRPQVGLPADLPTDDTAVAEYAYWQGFEDPQWWHWGASLEEGEWSAVSAARAFDGQHAADLSHEARVHLAARGDFDWLTAGDVHPWDDLREVAEVLPARPEAARAFVRAMRMAGGASPRQWAELYGIPLGLGVLPPAEVTSYVIDHVRLARELQVECIVDEHTDCIAGFARDAADVLFASWVRADGGDVDRLFSSRDPLVQQVAVSMAQRVTSPEIARRVRALFKQRGHEPGLVWALARQADPASIWALESALEADPDNTTIRKALAVFHPDSGAMPELPEDPEEALSDAQSLRLLDGLFALEPAAIAYALKHHQHARLGLVAMTRTDDELALIWPHLTGCVTHEAQLMPMRELYRRVPENVALRSIGEVGDKWNAGRLFGGDPSMWRRYLHELADAREPRHAMWLADAFARQVAPDEFIAVMRDLWDAHEQVFIDDVGGVLEHIHGEWPTDCVSFRLVELFIAWAAPRVDVDLAPLLDGKLRSAWVIERWSRARAW